MNLPDVVLYGGGGYALGALCSPLMAMAWDALKARRSRPLALALQRRWDLDRAAWESMRKQLKQPEGQ